MTVAPLTRAARAAGEALYRAVDRLTLPPVLPVFAVLQAIFMSVVVGRYLGHLDGVLDRAGHLVTGDFMAFFSAATILRSGRGASLYDLRLQRQTQVRLTGVDLVYWQPYVNPPALALALAPVAGWTYLRAFYLFCGVMAAALLGALLLLGRTLPHLRRGRRAWLTLVLGAAAFHPVIRTAAGGQNTPLTIFFLAGLWAAVQRGRSVLAGGFLGLLSFKPQYTPLLALVLVLRKRATAMLSAAVVGGLHYALAAVWCGLDWPLKLVRCGAEYRPLEWASNVHTHASLIPFFDGALPRPLNHAASILAVVLVVAVVVHFARRVPQGGEPAGLWALAITAALLVSPHMQYYDVGILVLPAALALDQAMERGAPPPFAVRTSLLVAYFAYPLQSLSRRLHFQPLLLWLVGMFGWITAELRRPPWDRARATAGGGRPPGQAAGSVTSGRGTCSRSPADSSPRPGERGGRPHRD